MKLSELKKTKPATMKSSGTDDPKKYVGKWEEYDEPQGILDRQDPKVLAKESGDSYGPHGVTRFGSDGNYEYPQITGKKERDETRKSKKAPMAQAKRSAKALSAKGHPPSLNPRTRMDEKIRIPILGSLSGEYEIVDDNDKPVGFARVKEGVIDVLDYLPNATQEYRGQIVSALLHDITREADRKTANLSIQVNEMTTEIKSLLERFGFRETRNSVMKRGAGSIRPTSVNPPQGMTNRSD